MTRKDLLLTLPYKKAGFGHITSFFRYKRPNHNGVDFSYWYGTPLVAPHDGVVTRIVKLEDYDEYDKDMERGFGVEIEVIPNVYVLYWHCIGYFPVKVGDKVKQGQIVAFMGNSGMVMRNGVPVEGELRYRPDHPGKHVHIELFERKNGKKTYYNYLEFVDWSAKIKYPLADKIKAMNSVILKVKKLLGLK